MIGMYICSFFEKKKCMTQWARKKSDSQILSSNFFPKTTSSLSKDTHKSLRLLSGRAQKRLGSKPMLPLLSVSRSVVASLRLVLESKHNNCSFILSTWPSFSKQHMTATTASGKHEFGCTCTLKAFGQMTAAVCAADICEFTSEYNIAKPNLCQKYGFDLTLVNKLIFLILSKHQKSIHTVF